MPQLAEALASQLEQKTENEKTSSEHEKLASAPGLYVGRYKHGPVLREQIFYARSESDAFDLFNRYVTMLRAKENNRCSMVGVPKPMALDIEKELDKFREETGRQL